MIYKENAKWTLTYLEIWKSVEWFVSYLRNQNMNMFVFWIVYVWWCSSFISFEKIVAFYVTSIYYYASKNLDIAILSVLLKNGF